MLSDAHMTCAHATLLSHSIFVTLRGIGPALILRKLAFPLDVTKIPSEKQHHQHVIFTPALDHQATGLTTGATEDWPRAACQANGSHLRTSEVVTRSLALPAPQCAETDVGPALHIKSCNGRHSPKTAAAAAPQLAAFHTRNESR